MSEIIHESPSTKGTLYLAEYSGGEKHGMMVQVGQDHDIDPDSPDHCGFIQLTAAEAAALGERLLVWAAQQERDPHGLRDWTSLESRLASHLWDVSALRHGMFTPPQFSDLCEQHLRAFFQNPPA